MKLNDALGVMKERAMAIERAPGTVMLENAGMLAAPGTMTMLLQGVSAPAEDVMRTLEMVAAIRGLPSDAVGVLVEVFVLGSLVGQS